MYANNPQCTGGKLESNAMSQNLHLKATSVLNRWRGTWARGPFCCEEEQHVLKREEMQDEPNSTAGTGLLLLGRAQSSGG